MQDIICASCGGYILNETPTAGFVELKYCNCLKWNLGAWECPRCRKIHSPYKLSCDCMPTTANANTFQQ